MRIKIFAAITAFFLFILTAGLFYIQVVQHDSYRNLSERNRVRVITLAAPRGKIFDRSGTLLVNSRIAFDVEVIYQEIGDKKKIASRLADILDIDEKILLKRIHKARDMPFAPVQIAEDIEKEKAILIEETRLGLPGVIVTTRPLRNYIYKNSFSHIIGYIGRISGSELDRYETYGYKRRDFVGKDGIERSYNDYLRGVDGGLQVEVDSMGRQCRILAVKEPHPGRDLYLSIDSALQEFCNSILAGRNGAILAMHPATGEILALVSHADFDPNLFVNTAAAGKVRGLLADAGAPMLNRAINGLYPPGSVFKIVIATGAMDSGTFNEKKTLFCNGALQLGDRAFHCWNEDGHGVQILTEAIRNSCNVFFYQLGLRMGPERIARYAFRFGFGRPTGIDLPGESSGFVPTPSWKRRKLKEPWFKGETANYSIGQGYLLVTPVQILRLVSAVCNGGKLVQPFVVRRIEDLVVRRPESQHIGFKDEALEVIKNGLKDAINAPGGTGLYARSENIVIAGKTGTAQNPGIASHAWFAGFAPFDDPKICVVVLIEHGGKGGLEPARFAKSIIEEARKLELL